MDTGGGLKITVAVSNPNHFHLQVGDSPQCPFTVTIFPDSTGQSAVESGTTLGENCSPGTSMIDLAPGDSVILSRTLAATDVAQFTSGLYGVNVAFGWDTTFTTTGWGGAVRLPLSSKP